MAFIGTDNQSMNVMKLFLSDERVQVVAVGDVNKETPGYWDNAIDGREPAKRLAEEHYGDRGIRFRKPRLEQTRTARAAAPPPEGLNYDLWLGPAPDAPFCGVRLPVN